MSARLPAAQRKDSILQAASGLFATRGYHGVSIDEIAREVEVSPAILYRHFASKKELYDTVLHQLSGKRESYVDAVIQSGTSFEDVLAGMTSIYINSIAARPDLLRIELQSLLDGNAASREFFENRWKSFADYIEFSLNEILPYELANREVTILSASLMFQGILREVMLQKFLQPHDRLEDVDLDELSNELVRLFLRAIGINKSHLSRKAVIKD